MTALIVVESSFGNTLTVAKAIASGLTRPLREGAVTVVRPTEARPPQRGAPTCGRFDRGQAAE